MTFELEPIGVLRSARRYRFEAPRQAVFADDAEAVIELAPGRGFEDAVRDLASVERIWVVFCFHLNANWRPLVTPPVAPPGRKIGVFATRSPHRPNRIGISAVELRRVDRLRLELGPVDILDNTPVLDIKPYIPAADAFPNSRVGWLEEAAALRWDLEFGDVFCEQAEFIRRRTGLDLENFANVQLRIAPFDDSRKRLTALPGGRWRIGCRTWQLEFSAEGERRLRLHRIHSHYTADELAPDAPDPHGDKTAHRAFREIYR